MNYAKIYDDLIESRKVRPKLEEVYYERHHIVPRCMGGDDDPSNLIYLTAEEHFIAHLLLAHAYGGKLWLAANAMTMGRGSHQHGKFNRRMFGIARRELGSLVSERVKDRTVYKFREISTGKILHMTRQEAVDIYGIHRSAIGRIVRGSRK